ncbi:MAG: hypothetical protein MZV64_28985 [Ignavibacteriales bacterium]|nr:hypothetical protein [Ignavibacteriales bacterium]
MALDNMVYKIKESNPGHPVDRHRRDRQESHRPQRGRAGRDGDGAGAGADRGTRRRRDLDQGDRAPRGGVFRGREPDRVHGQEPRHRRPRRRLVGARGRPGRRQGQAPDDLRLHPRARRGDERLALVEPDPAGQGAGFGRRGAQAGETEQAAPCLLRRRAGPADGQLQRDDRAHHRPAGEARAVRPRARGGLRFDDRGPGRGHRGPGPLHAGAFDAGLGAGRGAGPGDSG